MTDDTTWAVCSFLIGWACNVHPRKSKENLHLVKLAPFTQVFSALEWNLNFGQFYLFKCGFWNNVNPGAAVDLVDGGQDEWDCLRSLGTRQPGWCWQADSVGWRVPFIPPPACEHAIPSAAGANSALSVDGQDGCSDCLSSRSRKWELEGSCYQAPSFLPVLHGAKPKPCVCLSPHSPARLVRKCCGHLNNMWSQEAFNPSPRTIVTWIPLVYNATVVSGGGSRKWFLSVSGPRGVPTPPLIRALPQSFHSTFAARWMWLGKYSSVSPGPKVISWHSSCHRLTRNRLREMVCSDNGGSKPYLFAES